MATCVFSTQHVHMTSHGCEYAWWDWELLVAHERVQIQVGWQCIASRTGCCCVMWVAQAQERVSWLNRRPLQLTMKGSYGWQSVGTVACPFFADSNDDSPVADRAF